MKIMNNSKVNLTISGINILNSGDDNAGLGVSMGSEVTIMGGSADSLNATGGYRGAGIGGGY